MEIRKSFYDLCVPYTKNHKELSLILKELHECSWMWGFQWKFNSSWCCFSDGYRTVAIDQPFDHTKETKKSNDSFPVPVCLDEFKEEFKNKLQILNRITITYTDSIINHAMV